MPRKGANISLSSYDDIFETDESRADSQLEKVQKIPISELVPFKNHPFKVVDDEAMLRTTESIAQFGVLTPLIARPLEDGGYEIISGHRRAHAAEAAGLMEVPVIVRDMDDDAATVLMVDSNLQRESILPSERAFAYKMKLEAMKHQGERTDLQGDGTSGQIGQKLGGTVSRDILAEQAGDSSRNVQRFIRLTNLIPELLDMVDQKQISFNPAVELSYLTPEEQQHVIEAMDFTQAAPSLSQAQRLKKLSQEGGCTLEAMQDILGEVKKGDLERVAFKSEQLRKYFPKSYSPKQMQDTIIKLLEQWQKKRQRDQER
jgi:ParB family chromosome partitioning protein